MSEEHKIYTVIVTYTRPDGTTIQEREPFESSLRPMPAFDGDDVLSTARQIWLEAGQPKHAYIEVQVITTLGEFTVEGDDLKRLNR
jgi:hypothetical protein